MKYIFVTGGVVSGLGKGICAASLGRLLKQCGLRVKNQKFDPYLNVDPGTMSPYQHGEVFVTDDGAETDLDLGHYERFVDEALNANASVSSGKVYWSVLNRERQGGYLGGTVQIIPHVTDEIKSRVYAMDDGETDVCITEIGGTVGDIESQPFLEAIRQVAAEKGREDELALYANVEKIGKQLLMERQHKSVLSTNIDFYSGFVYEVLGLPKELYTPLFAVARIAGWSAHRMEELSVGGKLIRPRYECVEEHRPYTSMDRR